MPPPSSLGQNRVWLSETHPKAETWHCRRDVRPCLGGVIKIREGNGKETVQMCPRFPVCFLQPWGAAWGIPLQDPAGHMADVTGFKMQPEAPPNPHPAPAATWSLSGLSASPRRSRWGCELSCHVNFPPEPIPTLSWMRRRDAGKQTVNLYRTACQAFLVSKEKIFKIGI